MDKRSEPVAAGGRAVAVSRHRADAVLLAASLPALAVPNRLRLAEKGKGASCLASRWYHLECRRGGST